MGREVRVRPRFTRHVMSQTLNSLIFIVFSVIVWEVWGLLPDHAFAQADWDFHLVGYIASTES
jgi:hypothetical protein